MFFSAQPGLLASSPIVLHGILVKIGGQETCSKEVFPKQVPEWFFSQQSMLDVQRPLPWSAMKRKHSDSGEKVQKPKQIEDEGKKLKLSPKKNRKTLAGQKQTEELSKEPSDKKGLRPTKKTRAKTQNHENHEDQEDQEATARTAGTAAGKPAKPKATEDVEAEQQRRALQREIQQLVMRHNSAASDGKVVSKYILIIWW